MTVLWLVAASVWLTAMVLTLMLLAGASERKQEDTQQSTISHSRVRDPRHRAEWEADGDE